MDLYSLAAIARIRRLENIVDRKIEKLKSEIVEMIGEVNE